MLREFLRLAKIGKLTDFSKPLQGKPRTRSECVNGIRPCPFVSCRYNLFLEVSPISGSIHYNFDCVSPADMDPDASCALDVSQTGPLTLGAVAKYANLTRERIRQIETAAMRKLLVVMNNRGML